MEKNESQTTELPTFNTPTRDPDFEVYWKPDDPENPVNWSIWYRGFIVGVVSFSTTCVILYSTSYTSGVPGIQASFGVTDRTVALLGLTTYLLGLALGCLILAPMSEMYGRRPVYLVTMALFAVLILPVALAPNFAAILASRVFGGFFGSATVAIAPGSINDVVSHKHRALAFSMWSLGAMNGPVLGPIIGGFVYQYLGWRWIDWIVLICAGASFVGLIFVKETYAPIILRTRTKKKQKETGNPQWWCQYDHGMDGWKLIKANLTRPLIMATREPICMFWNFYVGIVYAVLFLCFVGYPIVFEEQRGWSPGIAGLGYLGIGIGTALTVFAEPLIRKMINRHPRDPATGLVTPEAAVSPICIGSVLIPIGEFWFSWTARRSIHWISPIIAGGLFGMGNTLVFIYSATYLASSYTKFAASALAGNSLVRYVFGGVLPLAGSKMYHNMGVNFAGTMLGVIEVIMIPIPFVFYRYGRYIRQRSPLISKSN